MPYLNSMTTPTRLANKPATFKYSRQACATEQPTLALSNAEVARRIGLSEPRYTHYVSSAREPDLATLVRIAKVLETTPNDLLGCGTDQPKRSRRVLLKDRLIV